MRAAAALALVLILAGCAAPGSPLAGLAAPDGAPYGCGILDFWTPETQSLRMDTAYGPYTPAKSQAARCP